MSAPAVTGSRAHLLPVGPKLALGVVAVEAGQARVSFTLASVMYLSGVAARLRTLGGSGRARGQPAGGTGDDCRLRSQKEDSREDGRARRRGASLQIRRPRPRPHACPLSSGLLPAPATRIVGPRVDSCQSCNENYFRFLSTTYTRSLTILNVTPRAASEPCHSRRGILEDRAAMVPAVDPKDCRAKGRAASGLRYPRSSAVPASNPRS
ncbi:MAG: hypothetical protein QOH04_2916 [Sphingomonadales bacterium]|jgi:hypothetical protein|nr:hypothetical protein [Sphingomonadales bacterium]